ncbi:MAG: alpha-L-glutamate ligase [Myxococcota bacterium]|nr:alpha-L-glutamate ligase [Myxococcota bacterium]
MKKNPTIHILFENPDWLPPLINALAEAGFTDVRQVKLSQGLLDARAEPPEGIWINRISPSSHTRGNIHTVQLARDFLYWLELHNRRVINGLPAFELEMSKFRQDLVLQRYGIRTPKTILVVGQEKLREAAKNFNGPFITKHNQGGKGLGIELFTSVEAFHLYLESGVLEPSPDGKFILQEYIAPRNQQITRVEIVGDRMLFAMHSSTKDGFELCPSDVCQRKSLEQKGPDVCPIDGASEKFSPAALDGSDPLVIQYIQLMQNEGIDVAGIEFVEDEHGVRYTYDINGTTNYNDTLGKKIGVNGMSELVSYIQRIASRIRYEPQLRVG